MTLLHNLKLNSSLHVELERPAKPTRHGYGDALVQLGKDKRIMVLCADLIDSTRVRQFADKYPNQFVEVGVAEQALVTIGAGLAAVGKIPFVSSYAAFCPGRCWEQIRTTICYNNQNVKVVGAHAGISVGPDGATHQILEDIAIMRALPNMIVVVPCDYEQTKKATIAVAKWKGPAYLRMARSATGQVTTSKTPFTIGKAQVLCRGKDITLIAAGPVVYECILAAKILRSKGISAEVINSHTIKPLDTQTLLRSVRKTKRVVSVEEGQIAGGLGGAVAEMLGALYPAPLLRLGIQDQFGESGEPQELLTKFGLTGSGIVKSVQRFVKR